MVQINLPLTSDEVLNEVLFWCGNVRSLLDSNGSCFPLVSTYFEAL